MFCTKMFKLLTVLIYYLVIHTLFFKEKFYIYAEDETFTDNRYKRQFDPNQAAENLLEFMTDLEKFISCQDCRSAKETTSEIIGKLSVSMDSFFYFANTVEVSPDGRVTDYEKQFGDMLQKMEDRVSFQSSVINCPDYRFAVDRINKVIPVLIRLLLFKKRTDFDVGLNRCSKLMPNFYLHWISEHLSQCCFLKDLLKSVNYDLNEYKKLKKQIIYDAIKAAFLSQTCLGIINDSADKFRNLSLYDQKHALQNLNEIVQQLYKYEIKLLEEFDQDNEYGVNGTIQEHFQESPITAAGVSGLYSRLSDRYDFVHWAVFCLKKDEYYVLGTKYSILEGSDCNLIVHYTNLTLGGQKGNRDQLKKTVSSVIDEIADRNVPCYLEPFTKRLYGLRPDFDTMLLVYKRKAALTTAVSKFHITEHVYCRGDNLAIVFG